jgi:DNA-binding NtrC family response regulator
MASFIAKSAERTGLAGAPARLIGEHPSMVHLRELIERIAATDSIVLISGESGVGKEVVARAIHAGSRRGDRPFIPVNCAAIPHEMLESEMFGHERGAFTGAVASRQGLFAAANGGTIFLDEVGEMPLALQVKLLRVLEDREVRPLGTNRAVTVDMRVIAASNRDLAQAVGEKNFREDLFYRLQVVPITVPPLRQRRSDIPVLVEYFLERLRARHGQRNWSVTDEAMAYLWSYDWPGNVRELENLLERLTVLSDREEFDVSQLPEVVRQGMHLESEPRPGVALDESGIDLSAIIRNLEGRYINEALRRTGGNKQAAARLLGLKRTTFSAKLRRCGVISADIPVPQ